MPDVIYLYWRTGRKLGRTIYAMLDHEQGPQDHDVLLGMVDDPHIGQHIVDRHNEWVEWVRHEHGNR